jgi:hypothetical protein
MKKEVITQGSSLLVILVILFCFCSQFWTTETIIEKTNTSKMVIRNRITNAVHQKKKIDSVSNQSVEINSIHLVSQGKNVSFMQLQEPLFVLFGNAAYKTMLANYVCNTALFPGMHERSVIITTDHETMRFLESLQTKVNIWLIEDSKQEGYNYGTPMYLRLMLLRGRHLLHLLGKKTVIWLEADAAYYENLLDQPEIVNSANDLTFFWDWQSFGGGFIRFAATETAKHFYEKIIEGMMPSDVSDNEIPWANDQAMLNQYIKGSGFVNFSVFDDCKYRSGVYYKNHEYQQRCANVRPIVQQHNWIVGVDAKIALAKDKNVWFLNPKKETECRQRDLRIVVMTKDRPASLMRLLHSIKQANYPKEVWAVDLQVNVDRDFDGYVDEKTLNSISASTFGWELGMFASKVWESQVGLLGQWLNGWECELFPPSLYRAVILLEDDLEVSPLFAQWFLGAHEKYKSNEIGSVTGMRVQLVAKSGTTTPVEKLIPKGVNAFAYKLMATWSLSPTYENWRKFREWYYQHKSQNINISPIVNGIKPSEWYSDFQASGNIARMWEMWYIRFTDEFNYYTIYPWIEDGRSTIVCNWKERGLNYDGSDNNRDFPLIQSEDQVNILFSQDPLPKVEWDMVF